MQKNRLMHNSINNCMNELNELICKLQETIDNWNDG